MGSWFPAKDSIAKERNGRASARPLCFRMSGQAVPDRQVVAQCLAGASVTHYLTALCWAHNDVSLYLACCLTSARQVAVAWLRLLYRVSPGRWPHLEEEGRTP